MIESPSGRVLEKAPRWDLTGTEACGGGKVFWWTLLLVWEYLGIYRAKSRVGGLSGCALRACGPLETLLTPSPSSVDVFWSKKNHRKVLFCLDSVWYSFSVKLKNKEKTETGTGL